VSYFGCCGGPLTWASSGWSLTQSSTPCRAHQKCFLGASLASLQATQHDSGTPCSLHQSSFSSASFPPVNSANDFSFQSCRCPQKAAAPRAPRMSREGRAWSSQPSSTRPRPGRGGCGRGGAGVSAPLGGADGSGVRSPAGVLGATATCVLGI